MSAVLPRAAGRALRGVLLLAFLGSCCPVPWHRSVFVRPEGLIEVIDASTLAPVANATVLVRRYNLGPPPRTITDTFSAQTDSSGKASFTAGGRRGEWVMPLMMHGVPQWGAELCVSAQGYDDTVVTWVVQHEWSRPDADTHAAPHVTVALKAGTSAGCARTSLIESYPDNVTGVDHRAYDDAK